MRIGIKDVIILAVGFGGESMKFIIKGIKSVGGCCGGDGDEIIKCDDNRGYFTKADLAKFVEKEIIVIQDDTESTIAIFGCNNDGTPIELSGLVTIIDRRWKTS